MRWLRKALFMLFALFPAYPLQAAEGPVAVTIQGIDGRLYDNVYATLTIQQKGEDANLSRRQIDRMHASAEGEIRRALEPFGYYSPVVQSELRRENEGWTAVYRIDPGQPVHITSVSIKLASEAELAAELAGIGDAFPLERGDVLDHVLYRNGKKDLLEHLYTLGYVGAQYDRSEILVDRGKGEAEINLLVRTGPRYLFGETIFDQDLLNAEFLQGFVNYNAGEPFSRRKLITLQQNLYRTDYFGEVVVRGDIDNADGVFIPVHVRLGEPEYFNRYSFGLGYATDHGFRGKIAWDNRLFNRSGHSVSSELQIAQRESQLNFIYGIPVNDPLTDTLYLGATYNDRDWEDTETSLFKGGVNYDHTGGRIKYGVGFELHSERYQVGVTSGESFLPIPNARWSVVYGDDLLNTSNGVSLALNLKGAAEELFADTSFLQSVASGKLITSPLPRFRLIGRFSLGATLVEAIDDMPPSLRFYAGGDQSVRGYGYNELGSTDASGTVVGGKYLIFGSIEAEREVYRNWSIAAFFDVGKGVNDLSEDLSKGVGMGVRYRLPFGQIRVDLASALSRDDNPLRLHLTVGGDL